ncbi:MAG: AAA family ATPase, partial [Anaerolineales bacterium]|nr:AAA family ATPase [Anaerolineales bacterium]
MSKLELTLLGKPHILIDQTPLPQLASAKAKAILFYLAVTQERCSRETLAGLLWSDMPESSARASLRVALSKLRRHVGEHLQIKRRSVKLIASTSLVVDVHLFEQAAADPHTAVDLYTGPLLDDFYLRDAPLFDQWVEQERQRLHQQAINHLNQLAQETAAAAQFEQAITYARKLLTLEPWREETHRQLMQWLNQTGQRGAALSQFARCRQALQDHLDAQPAAETITLYETIKSTPDNPAPNTPAVIQQNLLTSTATLPPHNLHPYPTSFIGRADELHTVTHQLQTPTCRLLTITGTGGIGKTRLALETAQRLLPSFEHGVFYIPLVSLSTSTAAVLVSTIADALNLGLHGTSDPQEQLLGYLAHKQMLLVFDNFEHLLEAADLLLDLLTAAPQLKLLVTSREPLGLPEEWVLPLSGLPYKDEEKSETAAAQLFSERAQRLDLSFDPTTETAGIHHICALVEGLPLAIELAAAWVRVIPCTEIAAEIERNLDFLATELRIVPDHQTSIRAVFGYSWSLLTPASQTVLAKLAIFRGSFSRDAAEAVADASLRTLATLVDKSLIQKEAHGRFRIHPLIQQFALEQLSKTERHTLGLNHARYYTRFLHTRQNEMYSAADPQLLAAIKT